MELLNIQKKDRVATIYINRPDKLNALSRETLVELHQALAMLLADSAIGGIILTGSGDKAFVAGADIRELANLSGEQATDLARQAQATVFDFIHNAAKPVIAAINGYALGGGLELAMACHIRVACHTARLGLPEVGLGLIPGYGGTQRLTQLVGRGLALEMILTGQQIHAEKALQIGLINSIVSSDELLPKAEALMQDILKKSPKAVASAIRAVNAGVEKDTDGYQVEIEEFGACFDGSDFHEGLNAFLEKREPNFNG